MQPTPIPPTPGLPFTILPEMRRAAPTPPQPTVSPTMPAQPAHTTPRPAEHDIPVLKRTGMSLAAAAALADHPTSPGDVARKRHTLAPVAPRDGAPRCRVRLRLIGALEI